MKWLAIAFILIPTAELTLLIYSGQSLGFMPTMAIILLTAVGGAYIAKKKGVKAWNEIHRRMSVMETPGDALIDGVCILAGGVLLIIPGFITDVVGFLLLFSFFRTLIRPLIHRWIFMKMRNKGVIMR